MQWFLSAVCFLLINKYKYFRLLIEYNLNQYDMSFLRLISCLQFVMSDISCRELEMGCWEFVIDLLGIDGCWCLTMTAYEVFERMAYYGIASNLVIYLTTKLHEGTVTSSTNVSNWSGAIWMTPVLGAYIADTHWGRYWTFTVFSFIYILVCNSSLFFRP